MYDGSGNYLFFWRVSRKECETRCGRVGKAGKFVLSLERKRMRSGEEEV